MSAKAASGRPQFATTGREIQQFTYMAVWLAMTCTVDTACTHQDPRSAGYAQIHEEIERKKIYTLVYLARLPQQHKMNHHMFTSSQNWTCVHCCNTFSEDKLAQEGKEGKL